MDFAEPEESWDKDEDDEEAGEEQQEEEDEEEEVVVQPKKKPVEAAVKVRKDHINVVFIGHVGK